MHKDKRVIIKSVRSNSKILGDYAKNWAKIEEERKMDELETLIMKREQRGKGIFKGKLPLIC